MMAKGKKVPERSKLERAKPLPYTRTAIEQPLDSLATAMTDTKPEAEKAAPDARTTGEMAVVAPESDAPAIPDDAPKVLEAKPEPTIAAKPEAKPASKPERAARETIAMPIELAVGAPPAIPTAGAVEEPTFMPAATEIPGGSPQEPGTVPGRVPSGDSRSLRRGGEFALVYRLGSAVISRFGVSGTRGQWRVVEYPTPSSASNAYAKECSRFVADGFSDYRD